MQRNTLPNSAACWRPEDVNSPPHLHIKSKDSSGFLSAVNNRNFGAEIQTFYSCVRDISALAQNKSSRKLSVKSSLDGAMYHLF